MIWLEGGRRRWDGCGSTAGWLGAAAACCPVEGGWGVDLWAAEELQWLGATPAVV